MPVVLTPTGPTTDYATAQDALDMLGGSKGTDDARTALLGTLVTRCSRMFDRETGRPSGWYAPQSGVTRLYSGSGESLLDIDEWDAITAVTMTSNQARTDAQTLSVSDPTSPNYVEILPLQGPPYSQLNLLRGWLPDVYRVGNVQVTGNLITPSEVTHAVAIWAAYELKARDAGWADAAQRPEGPGLLYVKGIPPETKRIIDYYKAHGQGPKLALIGNDRPRSLWLDWMTTP